MQVSSKGIEFMLRMLLGALFVYAGAIKIIDPGRFVVAIRSYEMVGDPWAAWIAVSLPWLEVFAGACVIVKTLYRGALAILIAAMVVFLIAVAAAWARGLDIDCGCFGGKGLTGNYLEIVIRDALILAGSIFLFLRTHIGGTSYPMESR